MKKLFVDTKGTYVNVNEQMKLNEELATRKNVSYGFMNYLPDPDPVLRKQGKDISVYRDMLIDSHLTAVWEQRIAGCLSLQREMNTSSFDEEQASLYKRVFDSLDLDTLIYHILFARYYGFVVFEVIWQRDGKYVYPAKIEMKPGEWFFFDDNNRLMLRKKGSYTTGIEPEPYQFLLVQNRPSYMNPYGERLASKVFWNVTFKRGGVKFWTKFVEKYGMPFAIGKVPQGTGRYIKEELLDNLDKMVQDGVAVIPDSGSIELMDKGANADSSGNYKEFIQFNNTEITKAILTQTLTSDIGDKGSYAASKTHKDMYDTIVLSDKKLVERTINTLFMWIDDINFGTNNFPLFTMFNEQTLNIEKAKRDKVLSEIGLRFNKEYFLREYGLQNDDFDLMDVYDMIEEDRIPSLFEDEDDEEIV